MAKNTWQIAEARKFAEFQKRIREQNLRPIPSIYACIVKSMYDRGIDVDEIVEIVNYTQELWDESINNIEPMIEWVEETTGIELRGTEWIE